MAQPVLTKYKQGDLPQDYAKKVDRMKTIDLDAEADPNVSKKEKPSAQLLKKYAHGELSGAAEAKAGKEGLEGFASKKYTQGSFNE